MSANRALSAGSEALGLRPLEIEPGRRASHPPVHAQAHRVDAQPVAAAGRPAIAESGAGLARAMPVPNTLGSQSSCNARRAALVAGASDQPFEHPARRVSEGVRSAGFGQISSGTSRVRCTESGAERLQGMAHECTIAALPARPIPAWHCPTNCSSAALHRRAKRPQPLHFLHLADLDAGHRARRGGADRRAVGDERLPEGTARRASSASPRTSQIIGINGEAEPTGRRLRRRRAQHPEVRAAAPYVAGAGHALASTSDVQGRDGARHPAGPGGHGRRFAATR